MLAELWVWYRHTNCDPHQDTRHQGLFAEKKGNKREMLRNLGAKFHHRELQQGSALPPVLGHADPRGAGQGTRAGHVEKRCCSRDAFFF